MNLNIFLRNQIFVFFTVSFGFTENCWICLDFIDITAMVYFSALDIRMCELFPGDEKYLLEVPVLLPD